MSNSCKSSEKVGTVDVVAIESTIRLATERLVISNSERDLAFAKDKELTFMTGVMEYENTVMSKINCGNIIYAGVCFVIGYPGDVDR